MTSFFVGSQFGDIGLCNDNKQSYYQNGLTGSILSPSIMDDLVFMNAMGVPRTSSTPTCRFVHLDENEEVLSSGPFPTVQRPTDTRIELRDGVRTEDEATVNELQTTGESLYLFREGSASAWINSIETWIRRGAGRSPVRHDATLGEVLQPGQAGTDLPFQTDGDKGMVSIIGIDRCIDYASRVGGWRPLAGLFMLEQRRLDLASCASLTVTPQQTVTTEDGTFLARIGKGLPETPFIPPVHTKACVDFKERTSRNILPLLQNTNKTV